MFLAVAFRTEGLKYLGAKNPPRAPVPRAPRLENRLGERTHRWVGASRLRRVSGAGPQRRDGRAPPYEPFNRNSLANSRKCAAPTGRSSRPKNSIAASSYARNTFALIMRFVIVNGDRSARARVAACVYGRACRRFLRRGSLAPADEGKKN